MIKEKPNRRNIAEDSMSENSDDKRAKEDFKKE